MNTKEKINNFIDDHFILFFVLFIFFIFPFIIVPLIYFLIKFFIFFGGLYDSYVDLFFMKDCTKRTEFDTCYYYIK